MEKASIQDIPHLFDLFIDGHWQPGTGGQTMLMIEPSTGTPIGTIACGTANDIDRAVCKARETFEQTWRKVAPAERGRMMTRLSRLILEHDTERK